MRSYFVSVRTFAVLALLAALATQAKAELVSVGGPNNVAGTANVTYSSRISSDLFLPEHLVDGYVSNAGGDTGGEPGAHDNDAENTNFIFSDGGPWPHWATLTWTTPQHLMSLQAYVCTGGTEGVLTDLDRTVSSITFSIDQGSGFTSVGTVNTSNTNDVYTWDLTKVDGNWSNVIAVKYEVTQGSYAAYSCPRVAELVTVGVPEPSAIALLVLGMAGMIAYAWRRRK